MYRTPVCSVQLGTSVYSTECTIPIADRYAIVKGLKRLVAKRTMLFFSQKGLEATIAEGTAGTVEFHAAVWTHHHLGHPYFDRITNGHC
ncbi:hypothetical protein BHE74_00055615 [Ensete ventricosum]|nr:hypothetical protein BHE74_00055615 [Ensete ventricosum]RZS26700.1 hypothetical protein BHM03_00060078 [Ensete ventricosum]